MSVDVVFENHITEVITMIDSEMGKRMSEAVNAVHDETLNTLSGSRSGRIYKVPGTKNVRYQASAPGEPPASATGNLRQTLKRIIEGIGREIIGYVGSDREYAPFLEFGTRKMKPRPWLRISFERSSGKVKEIFGRPMD
jgi:HK97 gp10 family phage protein